MPAFLSGESSIPLMTRPISFAFSVGGLRHAARSIFNLVAAMNERLRIDYRTVCCPKFVSCGILRGPRTMALSWVARIGCNLENLQPIIE
jgi:hypothetical protein